MLKNAVIALGLLAAPLLHAQESQRIKTTLVTFALGAPKEGFKAFFKTGDQILEFKANSGGLGDPIKYDGPRRFVIRDSKEGFAPPAEGQQPKPPLAFVDLPERCDNILVIAADDGAGKLRLVAFDVASGNLRGGDYKFFNFSHATLTFIMGKQRFALKPSENKLVTDPTWGSGPPVAFDFDMGLVTGATVKSIKQSQWEHWPDKRNVVFLFDGLRKAESVRILNFNMEKPLRLTEEGQPAAPQ